MPHLKKKQKKNIRISNVFPYLSIIFDQFSWRWIYWPITGTFTLILALRDLFRAYLCNIRAVKPGLAEYMARFMQAPAPT